MLCFPRGHQDYALEKMRDQSIRCRGLDLLEFVIDIIPLRIASLLPLCYVESTDLSREDRQPARIQHSMIVSPQHFALRCTKEIEGTGNPRLPCTCLKLQLLGEGNW